MRFDFVPGAGNTSVKINFEKNESVTADANALIAISSCLSKNKLRQEVDIDELKRGEHCSGLQRFTAPVAGAEMWLASAKASDMTLLCMQNDMIFVQAGAFLAAADTVDIHVNWQGNQKLFSNQGLVWLNLQGVGQVVLGGFGAIYTIDVDGEYNIDPGHVLAFEETLDLSSTKPRGKWRFWHSRRPMCFFKGRGKVWCQSHNTAEFAMALCHYLSVDV